MSRRKDRTIVKVKTTYEGVHCYPGAPDEVAYLRDLHRHIFHVEVAMQVWSDDREIEFIMLKHKINKWFQLQANNVGVWNMGTLSCEQVVKRLFEYLESKYDLTDRYVSITVSEDNENGACVERQY